MEPGEEETKYLGAWVFVGIGVGEKGRGVRVYSVGGGRWDSVTDSREGGGVVAGLGGFAGVMGDEVGRM